MDRDREPNKLEEGLHDTEIRRETDIRNSLGPQPEDEGDRTDDVRPETDAFGRDIPGRSEDVS